MRYPTICVALSLRERQLRSKKPLGNVDLFSAERLVFSRTNGRSKKFFLESAMKIIENLRGQASWVCQRLI
jgi:hypothetical protein